MADIDVQSILSTTQDYGIFYNGGYQPSSGTDELQVSYPYTGDCWAMVAAGTPEDIDIAVESAMGTFQSGPWHNMLPSERASILHDIADVTEEHVSELATLQTLENGRKVSGRAKQIGAVPEIFRYFASVARTEKGNLNSPENKNGQLFSYSMHEPYGVVGAITPWNGPIIQTAMKLAPALAAGNTFVHKPSEETPVSALRFAEMIYENTELPAGAFNVVPGFGEIAGEALIDHPKVRKLAFTGSTEVGSYIGQKAGDRIVPVSLELGGKSANIVFPSARIERAVNGIIAGIFVGAGQSCFAGSRALVHESIYDQFMDQLTASLEELCLGDPMSSTTDIPPISTKDQYEKVQSYLDIANDSDEVTVYQGGKSPDLPSSGYNQFIRPTVISGADNASALAQEEIFGPVLCIMPFSDETEAVTTANDTRYGLAAGIWTEKMDQALRVAENLEAGSVWINEYRQVGIDVPFGGYKDSGIGREMGIEGYREYVQTKSVWIDKSNTTKSPFNDPETEEEQT
jgi:aldehyde dehydrogenase (NAD+)